MQGTMTHGYGEGVSRLATKPALVESTKRSSNGDDGGVEKISAEGKRESNVLWSVVYVLGAERRLRPNEMQYDGHKGVEGGEWFSIAVVGGPTSHIKLSRTEVP